MRFTHRMNRAWVTLAITAAALGAVPSAGMAQISVVVSANSSYTPTPTEILEFFTGRRTTWSDGARVTLVDQAESELGQSFYETFLRQSPTRVRQELTRLVFSGKALPPIWVDNSRAVKQAVAEGTTRIGYISTSAVDNTVKEVYRISS